MLRYTDSPQGMAFSSIVMAAVLAFPLLHGCAKSGEPPVVSEADITKQLVQDDWSVIWERTSSGMHVVTVGITSRESVFRPVKGASVRALSGLPGLRCAAIGPNVCVDEDVFVALGHLTGLERLSVHGQRRSPPPCPTKAAAEQSAERHDDAWLHHLGEMRGLRELSLAVPLDSARRLEFLKPLLSLRKLRVHLVSDVTDADLTLLGKLPCLEELELYINGRVTEAGWRELAASGSLRKVRLRASAWIPRVETLPRLDSLDLWSAEWRDEGIEELAPLNNVAQLSMHASGPLTQKCAQFLAKSGNLRHLTIRGTCVPSWKGPLKAIEGFRALEELDLCLGNSGSQFLRSVLPSSLQRLTLSHAEGVVGIERFRTLRHLAIDSTPLTDDDLRAIASLPDLESLSIRLHSVPPAPFSGMPRMSRLTCLCLSSLRGKDLLSGLPKAAPSLKSLQVSCRDLSEDDYRVLHELSLLQTLCFKEPSEATSDNLKSIGRLRSIEEWDLSCDEGSASLTDAAVGSLGTLPRLRVLKLEGNRELSDAALRYLKRYETLEELDLSGTSISDVGLGDLASLKKLRKLGLAGISKISDTGMESLASLTSLEELDVSGARVTDDGLAYLNRLSHLRILHVENVASIGGQGISRLNVERVYSGALLGNREPEKAEEVSFPPRSARRRD